MKVVQFPFHSNFYFQLLGYNEKEDSCDLSAPQTENFMKAYENQVKFFCLKNKNHS